jgi:hypothetical protein
VRDRDLAEPAAVAAARAVRRVVAAPRDELLDLPDVEVRVQRGRRVTGAAGRGGDEVGRRELDLAHEQGGERHLPRERGVDPLERDVQLQVAGDLPPGFVENIQGGHLQMSLRNMIENSISVKRDGLIC